MATRTNAKQMFVDALNKDFLAEGFATFLEVPLPEFNADSMTAEQAIIEEGKLSRHLNTIFTLFEGLFPLEIPLRMGQKNATQQGMLLAALEATRTVGAYYSGDLEAQAEELKTQIESVQPVGENVSISEEFWQQIYTDAGTLLVSLKSPQYAEIAFDAIELAQTIVGFLDTMVDRPLEAIKASTWRSLTSLSRLLLTNIQGGV